MFVPEHGPTYPGLWRTTRRILKTSKDLVLTSGKKLFCSNDKRPAAVTEHLENIFRPTALPYTEMNSTERNYPSFTAGHTS